MTNWKGFFIIGKTYIILIGYHMTVLVVLAISLIISVAISACYVVEDYKRIQ